jgi:hypothetical protein
MTQQKNPTSFYRRGTNNPQFAYYSEGNYAIVKPQLQNYYGFLNNVSPVNTKTNKVKKLKKLLNYMN